MAKTQVRWIEGMNFMGIDSEGRGMLLSGGEGPGVSPIQALLLGLGSCAAVDVVLILQKQRQPLEDLQVEVDGEREAEYPRPYKKIHIHFIAKGHHLAREKVERAIALSIEKYCGAYATLSGKAAITWDFEVIDLTTGSDDDSALP